MPVKQILEPLTEEQQLNRIAVQRALNRRKFIQGLGIAGAAAVVAGCSSSSTPATTTPVAASGPAPTDVLNFALNLEYLEASFYLYATTGSGLAAADTGTSPGAVTGGVQTTFTSPLLQNIATQIASDEKTHVEFLRTALAAAAVDMPAINLAALGSFATQAQFVVIARAFEDTGVSAYGGAAQFLGGTPYLTPAAQILAVEAFHASALRYFYIENGLTGAGKLDANDVPPTSTTFFDDTSALATIRTPSQVLQIVYATTTAGATSGGFFPNGVNGVINAV